jgi:tetratricopeptide (TPR) repeat protein
LPDPSVKATTLRRNRLCNFLTTGQALSYPTLEHPASSRESLRLGFSTMSSYYHLGRVLLLQKRYDEAIAAFEQARSLSPQSAAPEFGLSQVYLAQGDYDRALPLLLKQPRTPITFFQLSSAYAGRGDKEKALAILEKALAAGYRLRPMGFPPWPSERPPRPSGIAPLCHSGSK